MVNLKTSRDSVINFDMRTSCELYNRHSSVGLSVIRPNKKEIELNKITKNDVTVFYPFLKEGEEHDEPESVAIEYLYMKDQSIKITR